MLRHGLFPLTPPRPPLYNVERGCDGLCAGRGEWKNRYGGETINYKMALSEMTLRARKLRRNQTPAEKILWELLCNRRFRGLKFLRQHPIYFNMYRSDYYYITDFYCEAKKTVIELDGACHNVTQEYDTMRDGELLEKKGIKVLRLRNEEVQNLDTLREKLLKFIA